jgi:hypothetical protein
LSPILGIIASQNYPRITNSYESIATVTVGSGGSSQIEFSSIPSTFKHLQVRLLSRGTGGSERAIYVRFNSDSGSNYNGHNLTGNGSAASAGNEGTATYSIGGLTAGSLVSANIYGVAVIDVFDYQNTNKNKTIRSLEGYDTNGGGKVELRSGLWMSTSAVSTLTLSLSSNNFEQYSHAALYGIKG